MNPYEKNLLDLEHSLSSTKGASFLGFGVIGAFSFYFIAKEFIIEKNNLLILSII